MKNNPISPRTVPKGAEKSNGKHATPGNGKRKVGKRDNPGHFVTPTGRALKPARILFCKVFVDTGDYTIATRAMGYTGPYPEQYGKSLKHQLRAVWEPLLSDRLADLQVKALQVLEGALSSTDEKIQLIAARDIMDRGQHLRGMRSESGPMDGMTEKQIIDKITRAIGKDKAALLFPDLFPPDPPILINADPVTDTAPDPAPS